ncbi:MAG TPA: GAF domain-containing protein, partial [Pyrinomonadaceae bacterium]
MTSRNRPQMSRGNEPSKESPAVTTDESQLSPSLESEASAHDVLTDIVQQHPEDAPAGWAEVQEQLAASSGLSVLLVDGRQPPALIASNNNSICHAFQSSLEYVSLCDPYCGDAHRLALSAGSTVRYKCHAGLQCFTMPVQIGREQNLAAIGGRAFISGEDYRSLVDRFRAGELNDLLGRNPFENVIFAESQRLDQLSERLQKAARTFEAPTAKAPAAKTEAAAALPSQQPSRRGGSDRSSGSAGVAPVLEARSLTNKTDRPTFDLQREVERLRGELEHRAHLAESLQRFLVRISSSDPAKTYTAILTHTKELLQSERASLWVFDETSDEIRLKAAVGLATTESEINPTRLGEGISGRVLESERPLVVENLEKSGLRPAPAERNYRTKSFISYPITMSGRKIGVLNVADKIGGGNFDDA